MALTAVNSKKPSGVNASHPAGLAVLTTRDQQPKRLTIIQAHLLECAHTHQLQRYCLQLCFEFIDISSIIRPSALLS